jgi:23S rRNA (pseudouridine1915-N3)-methyltransferase
MRLRIAWIKQGRSAPEIETLTTDYLQRIGRYVPVEAQEFRSEAALLEHAAKQRGSSTLVLLDPRGRQLSSEQFADLIREQQERGTAQLTFAIGPADGFSDSARRAAAFTVSFGPMTFAHELSRVLLVEQIYRAFTILKGHPYHTGH